MKKLISKFKGKKDGHPALRIITLGGTTDVNQNLFVYEFGDEMIVFDCGIGLPDTESYGVEVIVPDVSYLVENSHKLKAFVITHAHEDHFGALPYVLGKVSAPIYSSKLAAEFIKSKLSYSNMLDEVDFRLINPDEGSFKIGPFTLTPFRVNHSVPGSLGFAIDTDQGRVIHVSDFKFDFTPVLDKRFEISKLANLCKREIICLLSDCLGAAHEGFTKSEKEIETTFDLLLGEAAGQVFITTISSNISRWYQAINSSVRFGRRVVLVGRSVEKSIEIATRLGYLKFPKSTFLNERSAINFNQNKLTYLIGGAYGQGNSSLFKVAHGMHKNVKLQKGASVIFSADPSPPSVVVPVNNLVNRLTVAGANVIYSEIQNKLHVSGHGSSGDLKLLAYIVRPKYYIPIGGDPKYMRAYKELIGELGFEKQSVFELTEGDSVVFENGRAGLGRQEKAGSVYLDDSRKEDIEGVVIKDRKILADDGIVVVIIPVNSKKEFMRGKVEIATRGFIYVKESKDLIKAAKRNVENSLKEENLPHRQVGRKVKDWGKIKVRIEKNLSKYLKEETGGEPLILPMAVNV